MALHGVTVYGTDVYGLSLPPAYLCSPFTAQSIDYGTIEVRWTKPSGPIFRYRLVSNRYGYPVNENDGNVVIDKIPFPGTVYRDSQVIPGTYHYYAIFVLADEVNNIWICGGRTACLAIQDFDSAWDMWNKLPEHFKSVPESGGDLTGNATDVPYLAQFLNVIGWGMDSVHTQYSTLARTLNDPMTCSIPDLWNMAGEMGLSFSPAIPAYTVRKAVQNWAHICRERGTALGLRNEIDLRTGWGADITSGPNIMLQNDQSLLLSPVFFPYSAARSYAVGELVWFSLFGLVYVNWVNGKWHGKGHWYRCIQACTGSDPTGDETSNTCWEPILDENDSVFGLVNPRTGNPSTWEVMAPSQPSSLLGSAGVTQGLGVANLDGSGRAWNALRFINVGGSPQNIRVRSISRSRSDLQKIPDPSFEAGFTIPSPGTVIPGTPWVPSWWPLVLFDLADDDYPGQRRCSGKYNSSAFWTFSNCKLKRSTGAAHTGTWGVILTPTVTGTNASSAADSPWVGCPASTSVTGSLWVYAPETLRGPQINLLPDPEFQQGTGGFTVAPTPSTYGATITGQATLSQSAAAPYSGGTFSPYVLNFTSNLTVNGTATASAIHGPSMPVTTGLSYTFSCEIEGTSVTAIALQWLNSSGTVLSSVTGANVTTASSYTAVSLAGTAPASAVSARFTCTITTAGGNIAHCYFGLTVSNSAVTPVIGFADQNGAVSTTNGSPVTLTVGVWTQISVTATSPANTKYAFTGVKLTNITASDMLWFDDVALATGVSIPDVPDPSIVLADGIDVPWVRPSQKWKTTKRYVTGDLVLYQDQPFKALRASTGVAPPTNFAASAEWTPLSENQRVRLCVSGHTSQNMSVGSAQQYAQVPYVEWFDQNGRYITRVLARTATSNGVTGKPDKLIFDSFTGQSRVVSASLTTTTLGPWEATFYANEELVEPFCFRRWDDAIDFIFGGLRPVEFVGVTGWSAKWVTTYTPNQSGAFSFTLTAGQGGSRMIVNGQTLINNWHAQDTAPQSGTLDLVSGTPVTIEVDYYVPRAPFTNTWDINLLPDEDASWHSLFRFAQWTTRPIPVIGGYPFEMIVQTAGYSSRGQITWYTNGTPIGTTPIVTSRFEDAGVVTITGTVPAGANFATVWISESGGFFFGSPRSQLFHHRLTEVVTASVHLPAAPSVAVSAGATQFTGTLTGRYTDDERVTWGVPTGGYSVGGFAGGSTWPTTPGQRSVALVTGPADTNLGVTFRSSPQAGQTQGIVFRYSSDSNYWRCGRTTLRKKVAGVWTAVATHSTPFADNDRMVIVMAGTAIHVYRNNNMVTAVSSATDSFNQTATSHGLIVEAT